MAQNVLGHVGLVQVAGVSSSDLHGDVLAEGSELGLGSDVVRGLELDDDAVGAAAMDVGSAVALIAGKAANLDVLLDDQDQVLQSLVNGLTSLGLASHQSLNISRVLQHDDLGCFLDEINELVVLGNEVSLSVDLDDNTDLALGAVVSVDHTLGSNAACLLGSSSQTTLAQDLNSLLEVAVSLSQSLLALHHAAVGLLAQFHNVLCRNSHFCSLPYTLFHGFVLYSQKSGVGSFLSGSLLVALLAFQNSVSHSASDQLDSADSVVVAGDDVVDLIGIAVGINDSNNGDVQLAGLGDSDALLVGVNDEHSLRQSLHVLDAAQVLVQLGHLELELDDFPSWAAGRTCRPPAWS